MPKTSINYANCCIYKIEHIEIESLVYVGLTTNFNKRKGQHKRNCNNITYPKQKYQLYQMIRDNGGWDSFQMLEVEKYPCDDRREAEKRETEVMKELKANMNVKRSYITEAESIEYQADYIKTHKQKKREYHKEYYKLNKDIILENHREYNESNKDKIKETTKNYYDNHKQFYKEYQQKYYENHKNDKKDVKE